VGLLVLLFVLLPFLDLFLLVPVGRAIGLGPLLGLVVAMGFLGAMLAQTQGRRVLNEWQRALAEGRVPEEGIVGGVLTLVGALFLITPGMLTDVVGLVLLTPLLRKPIAGLVSGYLARQVAAGRVRVVTTQGVRTGPSARPRSPEIETEIGQARFRPGEVIDTDGEEVK
jgi:UPF0716 protein FxsA